MTTELIEATGKVVGLLLSGSLVYALIRAGLFFGRNDQRIAVVADGLKELNAAIVRSTESIDRCFEKMERQISDQAARILVLEDRSGRTRPWRQQADGS